MKHLLVFYNHSNCVQLLCCRGFITSEKVTLILFFKIPPTFHLPFPKYLLIFSHFPFPHEFHRLKSWTMSQYKKNTRPLFTTTAHHVSFFLCTLVH